MIHGLEHRFNNKLAGRLGNGLANQVWLDLFHNSALLVEDLFYHVRLIIRTAINNRRKG